MIKRMKFRQFILLFLLLFFSCKKYDLQTVRIQTGSVSNIYATSAIARGSISEIGNLKIVQHGHCWSSANDVPDFRINQGKTLLGEFKKDGNFTSSLTGLYPNTTYYLRSFFIAGKDTTYGNDIQVFKTKDTVGNFPPNVATGTDSAISFNNFFIKGIIVNTGNSVVTAYGHCYSKTNTLPDLNDSFTNLGNTSTPKNFISHLTTLDPSTTYNVRAYATNATGTAYGTTLTVTTKSNTSLPSVMTKDFFSYDGSNNILLRGEITSTGNTTILNYGHVYNINGDTSPTLSGTFVDNGTTNTPLSFDTKLNFGSTPLSTYNYRAYATNANGTVYGQNYAYTTGFDGTFTSDDPKNTFDFSNIYGDVSAVYKKEIYFGLGVIDGNASATYGLWAKYNPASGNFTKLANCPYAIAFGNCFEYNNKIYVFGGKVNNDFQNGAVLLSYDPSVNLWATEKSYPNYNFWGASGFLIGTKYYACGGTTTENILGNNVSSFLTRTLQLNLNDYSITEVAALPGDARSNGSGFALNNMGYVVAGMKNYSSPTGLAECWQYNPSSNSWVQMADVPLSSGITGVAFGYACTYNGLAYAFSGIQNFAPNLNVSRYNPDKNTWEVITTIPSNEVVSAGIAGFVKNQLIYGCGLLNGVGYSTKLFILK